MERVIKPMDIGREVWLHLLFWSCVFLFSAASASWFYADTWELIEVYGFRTLLQMIVAYTIIGLLVPRLLNKGGNIVFSISVVLLLAIVHGLCTLYLVEYLIPTYPSSYVTFLKRFNSQTFNGLYFNFNQFFISVDSSQII